VGRRGREWSHLECDLPIVGVSAPCVRGVLLSQHELSPRVRSACDAEGTQHPALPGTSEKQCVRPRFASRGTPRRLPPLVHRDAATIAIASPASGPDVREDLASGSGTRVLQATRLVSRRSSQQHCLYQEVRWVQGACHYAYPRDQARVGGKVRCRRRSTRAAPSAGANQAEYSLA